MSLCSGILTVSNADIILYTCSHLQPYALQAKVFDGRIRSSCGLRLAGIVNELKGYSAFSFQSVNRSFDFGNRHSEVARSC